LETGIVAFECEDDLDLVEAAIPASLKQLEIMLANRPDDFRLQVLLARLYGSYAFGFVDTRLESTRYPATGTPSRERIDHLKTRLVQCYEKGADYALRALERAAPGAAAAFARLDTIDPYLDRLSKKEVGALFWYGFNLGGWVDNNRDSIRAISKAHVARRIMQRVIELDPTWHRGGAYLFLIAYYGSRPAMLGGSPRLALENYHMAKQVAGDAYLLPELLYARYCVHQRQDKTAFIQAMQAIADHPARTDEMALDNAIAARRAAIYLRAVDRLFAD
jgi:hypothetical protein